MHLIHYYQLFPFFYILTHIIMNYSTTILSFCLLIFLIPHLIFIFISPRSHNFYSFSYILSLFFLLYFLLHLLQIFYILYNLFIYILPLLYTLSFKHLFSHKYLSHSHASSFFNSFLIFLYLWSFPTVYSPYFFYPLSSILFSTSFFLTHLLFFRFPSYFSLSFF